MDIQKYGCTDINYINYDQEATIMCNNTNIGDCCGDEVPAGCLYSCGEFSVDYDGTLPPGHCGCDPWCVVWGDCCNDFCDTCYDEWSGNGAQHNWGGIVDGDSDYGWVRLMCQMLDGCPEWENGNLLSNCGYGYVPDCSCDGNCAPISYLENGSCDNIGEPSGYDLCCYDYDGGNCEASQCDYTGQSYSQEQLLEFCEDFDLTFNCGWVWPPFLSGTTQGSQCGSTSMLGDGICDGLSKTRDVDYSCHNCDDGDCGQWDDGLCPSIELGEYNPDADFSSGWQNPWPRINISDWVGYSSGCCNDDPYCVICTCEQLGQITCPDEYTCASTEEDCHLTGGCVINYWEDNCPVDGCDGGCNPDCGCTENGNGMACKDDGYGDGMCFDPCGGSECSYGYTCGCAGEGYCCINGWLGDGYCDDGDGCDLTCYNNDEGDC